LSSQTLDCTFVFASLLIIKSFFLSLCALQLEKSIEETKQSVLEREASVTNAENGAADLKERVKNLAKRLEEHERDYQVICQNKFFYCPRI
jgi:DNA-binding transcriptional regulator GbsR (MarR family)